MSKVILFENDLDDVSEKAIEELKKFSDELNNCVKESKIETIAVFGHYAIVKNI